MQTVVPTGDSFETTQTLQGGRQDGTSPLAAGLDPALGNALGRNSSHAAGRRLTPEQLAACTPAQKATLVETLLAGATLNAEEQAILRILDACEPGELDQLLGELASRGRLAQLFSDVHGVEREAMLTKLAAGLTSPAHILELCDELTEPWVSGYERATFVAVLERAEARGDLGPLLTAMADAGRGQRYLERMGRGGELDRLLAAPFRATADGPVPGGRIVGPMDLSEASEKALVEQNGGRGLLVPYGGHNPDAEPVVLVHGVNTSPESLRKLLDEYAGRPQFQVYVFFYDDHGAYLDRTGDDLARSLESLRADHLTDKRPPLRIIAHSMGGIISKAALNSMTDPGWFPEHHGTDLFGNPARVSGTGEDDVRDIRLREPCIDRFARIDLVTADTTWQGYSDPPINVRNFLGLFKESSLWDMVSNSALFSKLHETTLPPHLRHNQIEAGDRSDRYPTLGFLTDEGCDLLIQFFVGNGEPAKKPSSAQLVNLLRALRSDCDYPAFAARAREEVAAGSLTRERLRELVEEQVPKVDGTHTTMLSNPDLIVAIDREFARPW